MITAGDFRKGVTIEWEGGVWTIVDFQHVKPGKGAAFVRTKLKNVMTGAVVERSFNPTDKQPRATIETKEMQYVYNDGEFYYFMDQETFEQIPLTLDQVEEGAVNVGLNQATSLNQLLAALKTVVGSLPAISHGPARSGDIRHSRADNTRLLQRFRFPGPTPMAEGLARLLGR